VVPLQLEVDSLAGDALLDIDTGPAAEERNLCHISVVRAVVRDPCR